MIARANMPHTDTRSSPLAIVAATIAPLGRASLAKVDQIPEQTIGFTVAYGETESVSYASRQRVARSAWRVDEKISRVAPAAANHLPTRL